MKWLKSRVAALRIFNRLATIESGLHGLTFCVHCGSVLHMGAARVAVYTNRGKTVHVCRFCKGDFEMRNKVQRGRA
jgi:hypothetical protein